jgi:hypothetical protein
MFLMAALLTLNGVWVRPCSQGNIQVQFFEAQNNYNDDIFFKDQNCKTPLMSFSNDGRYQVRPGQMDFQFESVSITLYTNELASDFRARQVCGFSDWSVNKPRAITGLKCAFFSNKAVQVPRKGDGRFGIWKIENQRLYFGKLTPSHPATSPETRPIEWDPRAYFKQL